MATQAQTPPMKQSDEATREQLDLAKEQGKAYRKALEHMAQKEADAGGMQETGNYVVAYAVESAEGMYEPVDGELVWREPEDENVHIEVTALDSADGRFVPGLTVYATVIDEDGNVVGRHQQPFLWHPWLYHYGRNWTIPGAGVYTLKVEIEAPQFHRHDKKNGKRYAAKVEVTFDNVKMQTGQKK